MWCIRASAHNVPIVNGVEQQAGREFAARRVAFEESGAVRRLAMNLEGAYPKEAGLARLRREARFESGAAGRIVLRDDFEFTSAGFDVRLPLFTPGPARTGNTGELRIGLGPRRLRIAWDPARLTAEIARVELTDENLRACWGAELTRITFHAAGQGTTFGYEIAMQPERADESP